MLVLNDSYKNKYLKYKQKYHELKQKGGLFGVNKSNDITIFTNSAGCDAILGLYSSANTSKAFFNKKEHKDVDWDALKNEIILKGIVAWYIQEGDSYFSLITNNDEKIQVNMINYSKKYPKFNKDLLTDPEFVRRTIGILSLFSGTNIDLINMYISIKLSKTMFGLGAGKSGILSVNGILTDKIIDKSKIIPLPSYQQLPPPYQPQPPSYQP